MKIRIINFNKIILHSSCERLVYRLKQIVKPRSYLFFICFSLFFIVKSYSQCGPTVPVFNVDLTGSPAGTWNSPSVIRTGNCCGTSPPANCLDFIITLDPAAAGINFNIVSGAIPGGALFYQINCGPPTPLGQAICLSGTGPHVLTFCKPGNNENVYAITSIPAAIGGNSIVINDGCIGQISAVGYNLSTVAWYSVYPGAIGAYNSYLSCTSNCLNPVVTPGLNPPPYVDFVVCGQDVSLCDFNDVCDTIRVTFNPTLAVDIIPLLPTVCFGQTSTTITAVASGGTPPYTYLWNTGNPSSAITVGAGTYSVQLSDVSGCPPTNNSVTVTSFSVTITAIAGSDQTVCSQTAPVAILNGAVLGASGGVWSGGAGVFSPNNTTLNATYIPTAAEIAFGSVNLTLTTTGNGTCPGASDIVRINFSDFSGVDSIITTNVSCYGGTNGSIAVSILNGTGPFTYFWNTIPVQTSATASNLGIGTYSLTVEDAIGCISQISATITQPLPLVLSSIITNVSCSGGSNGSISTTVGGGTAPYTYLWQPGSQTSASLIGKPAGTYTVTVTDSKGCTATYNYQITQPLPLNISLTASAVNCFGGNSGSIISTISGGTIPYSYNWNPIGATSPDLSNAVAGTYTLTVVDSKGCAQSSTATVTQPTQLTSSITSTNETCNNMNNGTATAVVSGGTLNYSYSWQPGNQITNSLSNLASGTYTLTVTDSKGCTTNAFATISEPSTLAVSFINQVNVSCYGGTNGSVTAIATGGTQSYSYMWTPGNITATTLSNIAAGNYIITVTDNNGCQVQNNLSIIQPASPLLVIGSSTTTSCYAGGNGTLSSVAIGGTSPYTYNWMPGNVNTQNVSSQAAGTYTVTTTDAQGCVASNTVTVTQPPQIVATTSTVNSNCSMANGMASVSITGGTSPFSYSWSPVGGTNSNATGLLSGAYTVSVTDANGCSVSQWVNVNDNVGPSVTIMSSTNVSCYGGTGSLTYSWAPYGGTGPTATGLIAGTYTVTVSDSLGCQSLATTSPAITQPPLLSLAVVTSNVSCYAGTNGGASVSALGGTPGYTFQWLPGGSVGATISNLSANTYTVQVTDANLCVKTLPYTINQPNQLAATITSSTNVSCFGSNNGTATVSVSGGTPFYTYNWLPLGGNSPTGTGFSNGTYTVNITDTKSCTTSAIAIITQPSQALVGTSSAFPTSCYGGSNGTATINPVGGTPGYSYQWFPSGGTGQTATGLSQGNYFVLVTDFLGCQTNVSLTINQPAPITGTLSTVNPSCGFSNGYITSQLSGGTGPYSYLWLPNSVPTSGISGVGPGTYTLQVTDALNCTATFTATLTNISGPTVSIASSTNVSCFGGNNGSATANISQGTAPYSISWSPFGGNNLMASTLTAGNYTVTVIDALGCGSSAIATISDPPPLSISISSTNNVSCYNGSNGSITVAPSGGTPTYSYSWMPIASNSATINNLPVGTYTVNVTDLFNCVASISVNLTQPTSLVSSIVTSINPSCYNASNGSATVLGSGGTFPYVYSWSTNPIQTTNIASNLTAGTYTVMITDNNGCNISYNFLLTQPTQIITSAGANDSLCLGQSGVLTASASGGTGNYSYTWLPQNFTTPGTLTVSPLTTTTYTVFANDQNGCAGQSTTVTAFVFTLLPSNVQVLGSSPICPGQSTTVYVQTSGTTGPLTYQWNNGLGNGPGPYTVTPIQPTTYIVTVSNFCGSSVMDSVQILFNPQPTVMLTSDTNEICVPSSLQFYDNSVTGNITDPITSWYWTFGDGTSSILQNPVHIYTSAGTYLVYLTVSTSGGCTNNNSSAPLIINAYSSPIAAFSVNSTTLDLPHDILICTNQSAGANSYNWSFGDGGVSTSFSPQHIYTSVGFFNIQLIATSIHGCLDTANAEVMTNADVIFPNVFTPNSISSSGGSYDIASLSNDVFFPYTTGVTDFKLQIFNRWGELIFETFDIKQGWDGYYRGQICQQDVYVWKAYIKLNNGKTFNKTGDVTLLR